jgi:hypothetical protein
MQTGVGTLGMAGSHSSLHFSELYFFQNELNLWSDSPKVTTWCQYDSKTNQVAIEYCTVQCRIEKALSDGNEKLSCLNVSISLAESRLQKLDRQESTVGPNS